MDEPCTCGGWLVPCLIVFRDRSVLGGKCAKCGDEVVSAKTAKEVRMPGETAETPQMTPRALTEPRKYE